MGKKNQGPKGISRIGKKTDDIFNSKPIQQEKPVIKTIVPKEEIKPHEEPGAKVARGRPQEHKENWSKVTVLLFDRQIRWLDQLASDIRFNTKSAVSRAEMLRAAIDAIEESEINLSQAGGEEELKSLLLEQLRK